MNNDAIISMKDYSLKKGNFELKDINLNIYPNEIFALLGKTGCGKTLMLESITGFYEDGRGRLELRNKLVKEIPLQKRNIGMVYQDYALFEYMNVEKNIGYPLRIKKLNKKTIEQLVMELSEIFGINTILKQYPRTLSGGERQRVALARTLITNPDVLLLDEPFSAMDPVTKSIMYNEILKIKERFNCAIIFVTHDFREAQRLSDRIGIMIDGTISEIRTKSTLFEKSLNKKVNEFLGINENEM